MNGVVGFVPFKVAGRFDKFANIGAGVGVIENALIDILSHLLTTHSATIHPLPSTKQLKTALDIVSKFRKDIH